MPLKNSLMEGSARRMTTVRPGESGVLGLDHARSTVMSDAPHDGGGESTPTRITLENLWNGVEEVVLGSTLFRTLDAGARRELVLKGNVLLYPAGKVILTEGETSEDFYLVDQGVVEVSTQGMGDASVVLSTLQRGAFFGEVAMLTGMPRTATVAALTDVCVVRFDKRDIDEILDRNPEARRLLQTMIEGRARDAAEKVTRAFLSSSDE